ncbi:MAG: YhdP family protein [Candidatus Nitricoxidivorans perseverans]|uniref:YhdP family protein n=1 Tax=Candidatus Nitricoxidivorans perseverans TaxID=2975601 RepID=A0AA49IYU2_9PROT|nr:MAG: YhdP family protein [Candidatus Nitricoxidivorans perseverans]
MRLSSLPSLRSLLRLTGWTLLASWFAFALLVLALRHAVLPNIDAWRGDIEQALSGALRLPVSIRAIDARWSGLRPGLTLHGLELRDTQGRPALSFDHVEADISWTSLWRLSPHFSRLEIVAPTLDVRRDAEGRVFVAGLPIDMRSRDTDFPDWLLAQGRIVVREATVVWHDELRGAPPLPLARLNLDLRNGGGRHRFGLTAAPPRELASRMDMRGDFRGDVADGLGEFYFELDHADLAGWRAWADYPVELPRGSGGLRLWVDVADRMPKKLVADVRLADVRIRLAPELQMLDLERMEGRLSGQRSGRQWADGFEAGAKGLALARRDGSRIEPTDFSLRWRPGRLDGSANRLDLAVLRDLAKHFPVEAGVHERLAVLSPQGRLHDLRFAWSGGGDPVSGYAIHARFEDLGMKAQGSMPGFSGIDGRIDGSETGGTLELASRDAVVEMPAVFAEPRVAFAALDAQASWKVKDGTLSARIERAAFRNADAEGSASGRWRGKPGERGEIDLSAEVRNATGGVVWRYMPLVVNQDTRDWLRDSIAGGTASAKLRLKGDLARFPFRDGSGVFEVRGPFSGATLRYAPSWPPFDDVAGELAFVGERMTIRADRARLWGVALSGVKAEIADLELPEEIMTITGAARGPTADFLRFVEASPVGDRIDHFTEDMTASGNGELNLKLVMNLRHLADTIVSGRYRFMNNGLTFDADLPPLSGIDGDLRFTADRLEAKGIRASLLGAPMTVDVSTGEGGVAVRAGGMLAVSGLRKQYDHPVLDHLSGAAPWNGTIKVRKKAAEVRVESSLQGISSSLPEPFNKSAGSALPLAFERKPAGAGRDQVAASLGEALKAQLVRRHEGGKSIVERGAIAVGAAPLRLPERGVALSVRGERFDADFWRRLADGGNDGGNGANGDNGLPLTIADVRADELTAFGRTFNGFRMTGVREAGLWKGEIASQEANGDFEWSDAGAGSLTARLSRLAVPDGSDGKGGAVFGETLRELPAIRLTAKHFLLRGKDLGELGLDAENHEGAWNARLDIKNDDGALSGAGRWRPGADAGTRLDFKLSAKSIEKLLARLGHAGMVRRGTATLDGAVSWRGAPVSIDYPTLSGNLKLEAESGQFNKLEPGVGRLLGILSLQSLPRRITLDFRDVFSEGFAFDGIDGQFVVRGGVMETKDLQIRGPSAKVFMTGSVDLGQETQNLRVRVQPAVGETLATGVLLAHPATGAVVWLADKLLRDPLGKAFAFEYAVTGEWADPKVEKIQSTPTEEKQ